MERVLQLTPATVSQQWYEDGVAVDPGTVTVGIVRDDGTALTTAGSTSGTGTAARTFNLSSVTHTNLLDRLTATWVSATKGTLTSQVEIVGGFLFTIAEAKADPGLTSKTAAEISEARVKAEQDLERACRVAFVPRYESQTLSGDNSAFLQIKWPQVRAIRSLAVSDVTTSVTNLERTQAGLYNPAGWVWGVDNITVRYEHGYDAGEIQANRAALRLAKHYLLGTPTDDRAVRMDTDVGSYALATAGMRGARFGIPEVDAFVQAERYVLSVA